MIKAENLALQALIMGSAAALHYLAVLVRAVEIHKEHNRKISRITVGFNFTSAIGIRERSAVELYTGQRAYLDYLPRKA